MKEVFDNIDEDKNGELDSAEFTKAILSTLKATQWKLTYNDTYEKKNSVTAYTITICFTILYNYNNSIIFFLLIKNHFKHIFGSFLF